MEKETYDKIFSDFVLLDSTMELLNKYMNSLQLPIKEKYKRLLMIKEIAKKKLTSTVLDDEKVTALIKEVTNILDVKPKVANQPKQANKSFTELFYEESNIYDHDLLKYNFIYHNSIVYVDSIKDINRIYTIGDKYTMNHAKFSSAVDKPKVFLNHFKLLKYFLLKNPYFKTKFQTTSEGIEVTTLDSLQGNKEECFVLGMLSFNEGGKIQLQDRHKIINIDVSETEWGKGYYTQGCIVLAQGYFKNDCLKTKVICHPPPVDTQYTFNEKFEKDFFGAITKAFIVDSSDSTNRDKANNNTQETFLMNFINKDITSSKFLYPKTIESHIQLNLENFNMSKPNLNQTIIDRHFANTKELLTEEFFIVISNPDLSSPSILTAIEKIITSYIPETIPFMIVFMGNFVPERSYSSYKTYQACFENLDKIIRKNDAIVKNTYIAIIPGPDEFSLFSGFPKHPILETFLAPMRKKINLIAATNPARFSLFGKEVVFFRDNLNKKLSKNSLIKCTDNSKNTDFYVHTVLCQGNLAPIDYNITSRIWHLAHSMTILPLPDILVLADVVMDFNTKVGNTRVINPGNFTKDFTFYTIYPIKSEGDVEPCTITI
jgi:hypothetical protein